MKIFKYFSMLILYYSGIVSIWNTFANRKRPLIVYFHEVFDPSDNVSWCGERSLLMPVSLFRKQLAYLRRKYEIVDLEEAVHSDSSKVAAITFDDGYRGVYRRAFPILKEMEIPATVFLTTEYLGLANLLWWDVLLWQLSKVMSEPESERMKIALKLGGRWKSLIMRDRSIDAILNNFKVASSFEREKLRGVLQDKVGDYPPTRERIFLSKEEVLEMHKSGISFGSHTMTHPILTWLDSKNLMEELSCSKKAVTILTGEDRCWFAYPDGIFSERELKMVETAGYVGAVQTYHYPDVLGRFAVPRIGLNIQLTTGAGSYLSRARMGVTLTGLNRKRLRILFSK